MKHFTKEWYRDTLVAVMCFQVRKDYKAAVFSEKYFTSLYASQKSWFVKHMKRAAKHSKTVFNAASAEAEFDANYKENLDFVTSSLPQNILDKIADVRILALGNATQDNIIELTRYCGQINRNCEAIVEEYEDEREKAAETLGWYKINSLQKLECAPVASVEQTDGELKITTSPEVTEIACELVLHGFESEEGSHLALEGSTLLYTEILTTNDGRFAFSLLCESASGEIFEFSSTCSDLDVEEIGG